MPEEWANEGPWAQRRLEQLREDPTLQPWLLRAIVLRSESTMVGHVGFHARPGEKYLDELAPGGVELGYTVFERWRRCGYASEASEGLMDWAHRQHGVTRFVVSVRPTARRPIAWHETCKSQRASNPCSPLRKATSLPRLARSSRGCES